MRVAHAWTRPGVAALQAPFKEEALPWVAARRPGLEPEAPCLKVHAGRLRRSGRSNDEPSPDNGLAAARVAPEWSRLGSV